MVEPDIDALAQDTRVIRNRRKIEAIVDNVAKMLDLESEYGTFKAYIRSHPTSTPPSSRFARNSSSWAMCGATSSYT